MVHGKENGAHRGDQTERTLVDASRRAVVVDQRPLFMRDRYGYTREQAEGEIRRRFSG